MTEEERKFMRRGKSAPPPADNSEAKRYGRIGMLKRWGKHGRTKTIRAYEEVVDRFRATVPDMRDRADAASEALNAYLAKHGAPPPPEPPKATVAAVLTHHWYDEIEAGRKTTEYRDTTDYWRGRLFKPDGKPVDAICFSRGYTNRRMTWEVAGITENAADGVFEIHLGRRKS